MAASQPWDSTSVRIAVRVGGLRTRNFQLGSCRSLRGGVH